MATVSFLFYILLSLGDGRADFRSACTVSAATFVCNIMPYFSSDSGKFVVPDPVRPGGTGFPSDPVAAEAACEGTRRGINTMTHLSDDSWKFEEPEPVCPGDAGFLSDPVVAEVSGEGVQRDILPLPIGAPLRIHLAGYSDPGASSSQRRRARKRRATDRWLEHGIHSLNEMAGFRESDTTQSELSDLQKGTVKRLMRDYTAVKPPLRGPCDVKCDWHSVCL